MSNDSERFETVLNCIRSVWGPLLRKQTGEVLRDIKVWRILNRPYSTTQILEASTDQRTVRVVLKEVNCHPLNECVSDDPDQATVEINLISKLHSAFARIDRCAVPRPLLVLPEINAFMMEYVEGHILSDRLNLVHYLANKAQFRELREHFYDCGRWLTHFQTLTGPRVLGIDAVDHVLLRCHDRLRMIEEADDRRVPKDFGKSAMDFIERQRDRLLGNEIPVTGRHGDFGPWNILANPDGITVIDFFGYREDPVPVDICSMLVFFEDQELGLANSAARVRKLREQFVAGFGAMMHVPEPLILLCEAQQRILQIAGRILTKQPSLLNGWERFHSIRTHAAWFRMAPERSALWPR